jgi:hypothetical protein
MFVSKFMHALFIVKTMNFGREGAKYVGLDALPFI